MSKRFYFRFLILLAGSLFAAVMGVQAQGFFGLSVTNSANSVLVSNAVTFTINVTNFTTIVDSPDVEVTNIMPASTYSYSAQSSQGTITNYSNILVFNLGPLVYGAVGAAQMTVTIYPATAGFATNRVLVSSFSVTNTAATNVVIQVTNLPPTLADIGVAIAAPAQPVITNDLTSYELSVTNFGPATAPGISLTNILPIGVILTGANHAYTLSGSNMIFSLGSLTNGGFTNVKISIQPTNAGVLPLIASAGPTGGVVDTNTANNTATNSLDVIGYLPGDLIATVASPQIYNSQNGLTEQTIIVSNAGPTSVTAARVVVTDLLTNQLFNASGTNNGNPFVVYAHELPAGQSVSLLLQFYAMDYFSFSDSQMQTFAVPMPDLTPPTVTSTSTNLVITKINELSTGKVLIEFPSVSGRTYTIVYSDNVSFSNAMIAPPSVVAGANRKQWVDYGPPTTISAPSNTPVRFYRVIQNP